MTFVRGYKHDIFVSYAHVDDAPWPGSEERWVTTLINGLKIGLAQRLGRPDAFSLWMDHQLPGNKPLTPEIFENLEQSATLLIVLFPGYVASEWCKDEKNAFLQAIHNLPDNQSRVFVVKHSPLDTGTCPKELEDLKGYDFWADDTNTGIKRTLSPIQPRFNEELYNTRLAKLVSELAGQLKALNADARQIVSTTSHEEAAKPAPSVKRDPVTISAPVERQRVQPLPEDLRNPDSSLGLFVGIGEFDKRSHFSRLRYAPDDAVMLAHLFTLELNLISPQRVRLALGGEPSTERARRCLEELKEAQVALVPAVKTEILYAVEEIAELGRNTDGLIAISFSTHGYEEENRAFLMPADGARRFIPETGLPLDRVYRSLDYEGDSTKLLILDTCRASMEGGARGDESMSQGFQHALAQAKRMALLSSCGAGQLSWESTELEQGVFTHFLIEGLRGDAPARPEDGFICLENVFTHTLEQTSRWVRRNIRTEQLPWYGGEEVVRALPLGVQTEAKQRAEEQRKQREEFQQRKERAFSNLLMARIPPGNRSIITAALQQDVERELETLQGERLEELLDNLEKLADRKPSSCKMFASWWKAEHATTIIKPKTLPSLYAPWENSLGMRLVPLGKVLFAIWQTRLRDFEAFVGDTGYDASYGLYSLDPNREWKQLGYSWRNPGYKQGPYHPVAGVSWEDSDEFCKWLTEKERREGYLTSEQRYRLPSDEEWSKAVGGMKFPWGDEWPPPPDAGNYAINRSHQANEIVSPEHSPVASSNESPGEGTTPVGSFPPNRLGIYDLGGNVWEWCCDWYRKEMNPLELREEYDYLNDEGEGQYHFMRGASWFNAEARDLLSAYRNPGKYPKSRFANVGFRYVLEL